MAADESVFRREHSEKTLAVLQAMRADDPTTWGGVLKRRMVMNTVPDIQPNTKVLAICGITSLENAGPSNDGWFFSDFYLFNHLLKGTVKDQTWLTAKETRPEALVDTYTSEFGPHPYVHGNPYMDRKVVLDHDIVYNRIITPVVTVQKHQMLPTFLSELKRMSEAAKRDKSSVLVLIFAHGQPKTFHVEIGSRIHDDSDDSMDYLSLSGDDTQAEAAAERQGIQLLTLKKFSGSILPGVPVTILSTACFSGGWAISPDLNFTTLTAAGDETRSESWAGSKSLTRRCGSIFTSALEQVLIQETDPSFMKRDEDGDLEQKPTMEQVKTYKDFTRTVFYTLNAEVDRWAGEHDVKFSAQDDDWENKWTKRIGFPLEVYKARFDALQTYPAPTLEPLDTLTNEAPSDSLAAGLEGKPGYGSSGRSRERIQKLSRRYIRQYLASNPGPDSLSSNGCHRVMREVVASKRAFTSKELKKAVCISFYRGELMDTATEYLQKAKVALPKGQTCREFDDHSWAPLGRSQYSKPLQQAVWSGIIDADLFKDPTHPYQGQASFLVKPMTYLKAAFLLSDMSQAEILAKLGEMKQYKDWTIQILTQESKEENRMRNLTVRILNSVGKSGQSVKRWPE